MICVGLLGLGGVIFLRQTNQAQESAVLAPPTATPIPPTFTTTSTPSATPTETPLPTPTGTPVVQRNGGDEQPAAAPGDAQAATETPTTDPNVTPTNTRVLQAPTETSSPGLTATAASTPAAQVPASGGVLPANGHRFLIWAGVALLLLLVLGVVNHLRSSPPES